jgi:acetyl esterase/lipase
MVGYVVTVLIVTAGMVLSLAPLARSGLWGTVSWLLSDLVNESPFLATGYLCLVTAPALFSDEPIGPEVIAWFSLGCASLLGSPVLLRRSAGAGPVLDRALDEAFGEPCTAAPHLGPGWRTRLPWARIVLLPVPVFPLGVRVRRGLRYGPARRQRLDVYRGRGGTRAEAARGDIRRPVLIHLHGGAFRTGRKSFYARPLLHAFARHGWVCISASYRLRPGATYDDILSDVKRVVAWAREHASAHGADPSCIVLSGSSAGAHLAITTALTADDPGLQPGFEGADTSVTAAIGLYGYYGPVDRGGRASRPVAHAHPGAPPLMIVHGGQDTLLPPRTARHLAEHVRTVSARPVVYAELPGAQHTFDLLHSLRFELVVDALWAFCARVRAG